MSEKKDVSELCKSIFKNGESSISKEQFTQAYIKLVQQLEQSGQTSISPLQRSDQPCP